MPRTPEILAHMRGRLSRQHDRISFWLLLAQWPAAVVVALAISPWSYHGTQRSLHPHVLAALVLGGLFDALPLALIRLRPGWWATRHTIAVVQLLWSALFIAITGGRIESHFHVFGSLAFLALYRDWTVIVTATVVVVADHLLRGLAWPDSVYGIANPEWWRFLEHAAWVAFEDVILVAGCVVGSRELADAAYREAALEQTAATIQHKVENRTRQLSEQAERYRALVETTEAIPFEYDAETRTMHYIAPHAEKLFDCTLAEIQAPQFFPDRAHPDDRLSTRDAIEAFMRGERPAGEAIDFRLVTSPDRPVHLRMFPGSVSGTRIRGIFLDVTRQTQLEADLRQAHKHESVGRLAAGVAHEINTPIQFVGDSLEFTRSAVTDLLGLVELQQAALNAVSAEHADDERRARVAAALDEADLPYLSEHLPKALARALEGTTRVATIVRSMKVFAHDLREVTRVDLRLAIESTLTIASNEYKHVADLALRLDPVPRVTGVGSDLNQVLLNLVINAAHAIAERVGDTGERGKITVSLAREGDSVVIAIADTGTGIPDELRDRVFEPFFTTKPVGKGSGQGLALARAVVVDKHRGALTFETVPGVGTTFFVRLPIVAEPAALESAA